MFRTVGDQVSLWEAVLPPELLKLPDELARVDALFDDPAFFAPFVPFFDPRMGRPSTPMDLAALPAIYRRWSPAWNPDPKEFDAVRASFSNPASLDAAFGYYRKL